jgi:hypothetical protein
MMRLKCALWGVLIALVASSPVLTFAQGGATSSITGVVVDTADAVVPGATVLVKSNATGAESQTVTGANGAFTVPALNVGTYTVTITLSGFKTTVLNDVIVTAGAPATVRAKLEIGAFAENVVVQSGTEIVQTQSAAVSTTLNTKAITTLPLASRSTLNFIEFLPGVQTPQGGNVRSSQINGLPQSAINITLDGVNIQDNTNKTGDGMFAIVSPRLDAVEEVTVTSGAQGADSNAQGSVQVKFTTRSGSNRFDGSAYYFYQSDKLNTNSYENRVRGLPKALEQLDQPGFRQGGPVIIPGLFNGRDKLFFFVNYEDSRSPDTVSRDSNLMLPDAQNGIYKYPGGPAGGINLYQLAAANGQTATPDPTVAGILRDIRAAATGGGTLSPITGNLNAERLTFQQPVDSVVHYPTVRLDYNVTRNHRATGTWYRQEFENVVDTTNNRERFWPGLPVFGVQGSVRKATTGSLRSTFGASLVNEARVAYQGAPVYFSPNVDRGMWSTQGGFDLDIDAAVGIRNAGATMTPSARDAYNWTFTDTVTWVKGSHNVSMGGEYSRYDVWLGTYGSKTVPVIQFGTANGDPALNMFTAANFPGSNGTQRNEAAALYAVLTGRVTNINATARLDPETGQYVYLGDSRAEGRLQQVDFFIQDSWRARSNLTLNFGLRYAVQPAFYALNNSYSIPTLDDVWGISGNVSGCDPSEVNPTDCNLFKPGLMPGRTPQFQNLGEGVKAYNTDFDNLAPSIGVNWSPSRDSGFLGKLLGRPGDTAISAGYSRGYERHGLGDFTGVIGDNPGLTTTGSRSQANGNLTVPLLLRSGAVGPPPACPTGPNKPLGCMLSEPEYPLTNNTATGQVAMFDPNLQIPYADTWTVGMQRAVTSNSAISVRYIGTRTRDLWTEYNYNEANVVENGFVNEFRNAQANLQAHIAQGCGGSGQPTCSFAYRGPGTGTVPLPIYLAYFSGIPLAQAGNAALYTSGNFTSNNFINPLARFNPNPFTPAGTNNNTGLAGNPTRQQNAINAGLPANFFRANPDALGGANVTGNGGYTKYNAMQVEYARRLSGGLQFNTNYTYGRGFNSTRYSFRVDRKLTRDGGTEGDVEHAFKANAVYELPFGHGRRFAANVNNVVDRIVNGWNVSGTLRLQSGRLFDLGNVRVIGMSHDEVEKLFKLRLEQPDIAYSWPADIVENTLKAYSTSATSPTGYGALGAPSGRYFAPANGPDCLELIAAGYGDCGVRTLIVTGPMLKNFDLSIRKRTPIAGRVTFELSLDIFNVFNRTGWGATTGIGGDELSDYEVDLPGSARTMQIGTRLYW